MNVDFLPVSELRLTGPLQQTMVFQASRRKIAPLEMRSYEDDLGRFQGAFFMHRSVSVLVQRYDGNPPDFYTVLIDVDAARNSRIDVRAFSDQFLSSLELDQDAAVWRADLEQFH